MFFCLAFKNTGICSVLCISGPKSTGIYSIFCVFCMAPANDVKTQKCCNLQHFVTSEKRKIVRKMCQNGTFFRFLGPPKRIFKFHPLFVHPRPRKTWKPHQAKGFLGGSAAGARPRVAKAMLSFPHYTARRRRIKGCRPCRRPRKQVWWISYIWLLVEAGKFFVPTQETYAIAPCES